MRVKQIEDLLMTTSAERYQLSWVIEQLMADPRRIVQAHSQLHMGQLFQYWDWGTGKSHCLTNKANSALTSSTRPSCRSMSNRQTSLPVPAAPLRPPPEIHHEQDFRVGQRMSFTDQRLVQHAGEIVQTN